jgi:prophage DNA circulation protein
MSWRDRFNVRGRFRDAEFVLEDDSFAFGRRTQLHEYPERDRPYVEDLGRKAREFTIDVYVIGPDYDRRRDALIAAIEQPGPGTLVHPRHGTVRVSIVNARKTESTRQGGVARFSLTCVEGGEAAFPSAVADTPSVVQSRATAAVATVEDDFACTFSTAGQPEFVRDEARSMLTKAADAIDAATRAVPGVPEAVSRFRGDLAGFTGSLSSLIVEPARLAGDLTNLVGGIGGIVTRPEQALGIYRRLFGHGEDAKPAPRTTPARIQQSDNQAAVRQLMQRAAVIEAGRISSEMTWPTVDAAIATRDDLADRLDEQAETAPDPVYRSLTDLRVAVINDITARGAELDRLSSWTPRATLPALVLAHRIYGDAERAAEIAARNRIRHPGFVPGGEPLEVLREQ